MNKIKTVGIPASSLGETGFGATKNYLEFANKFGNVRIIMPWEEFVEVDLLILPGGMDVNPSSYGEVPTYNAGNTDVFKQFFFDKRLDGYIDAGIPIVGICLGMQQLAVKYDCKLTQDFIFHAQSSDRWATAHELLKVEGIENGRFQLKKVKTKVNSHHHQGVTLEDLNQKELTPLYLAENEDFEITGHTYIVEAFKHSTLQILGFQWHPEEMYDPISMELINELLQPKTQSSK